MTRTQNSAKNENGIFGISASRGFRKGILCHVFGETKKRPFSMLEIFGAFSGQRKECSFPGCLMIPHRLLWPLGSGWSSRCRHQKMCRTDKKRLKRTERNTLLPHLSSNQKFHPTVACCGKTPIKRPAATVGARVSARCRGVGSRCVWGAGSGGVWLRRVGVGCWIRCWVGVLGRCQAGRVESGVWSVVMSAGKWCLVSCVGCRAPGVGNRVSDVGCWVGCQASGVGACRAHLLEADLGDHKDRH